MATEYITKGEVFAKTLNLPTIYLKYDDSKCEPVYRQKDIFEMISNLIPAADVRPVVLCRDCRWWTKQEASLQGRCALFGIYPTGTWYCKNGMRLTNCGADMREGDNNG